MTTAWMLIIIILMIVSDIMRFHYILHGKYPRLGYKWQDEMDFLLQTVFIITGICVLYFN